MTGLVNRPEHAISITDWILAGLCAVVALPSVVVGAPLALLWWRARRGGLNVPFVALFGMRLRRVNARTVIDTVLLAKRGSVPLTTGQVETHALAGGNPRAVIAAVLEARAKGMTLPWNEAAAYDLAGRDVLEAVRHGVQPRVGVVDNTQRPNG